MIKKIIESAGLSLSAYRREAPADAPARYVIIHDGISETTQPGGDAGAGDTVIENVQVDLWQQYKSGGVVVESQTLANDLKRVLNGAAPLTSAIDTPTRTHRIRCLFSSTGHFADRNLVRTRYSVDVYRAI